MARESPKYSCATRPVPEPECYLCYSARPEPEYYLCYPARTRPGPVQTSNISYVFISCHLIKDGANLHLIFWLHMLGSN
jgi:hypothetical protein